jgi:hypothetical protein
VWWDRARAALPLCDGEYDVFLYAPVLESHSRLAGQFDISINGSNGAAYKGYWWDILAPFTGRHGHFDPRRFAGRLVGDGDAPGLLATRFAEDLRDVFAAVIRRENAGLEDHPNTAQVDNIYLSVRLQRWQGRIASATSRIWPCISPFAFRAPMEMALSAPASVRVRHRMCQDLMDYQDPRLAALPLAKGYPAQPFRLSNAHRFWPLAAETGRLAARRLWRNLGLLRDQPPAATYPLPGMWRLDEIREISDSACMVTRDLYEPPALRAALSDSAIAAATGARRAGRILTLELLARSIRLAPAI